MTMSARVDWEASLAVNRLGRAEGRGGKERKKEKKKRDGGIVTSVWTVDRCFLVRAVDLVLHLKSIGY